MKNNEELTLIRWPEELEVKPCVRIPCHNKYERYGWVPQDNAGIAKKMARKALLRLLAWLGMAAFALAPWTAFCWMVTARWFG